MSIQTIAEKWGHELLGKCAQMSCFSKNIRNQRTLGGEIAQKRLSSELYALLYAIQARLQIFTTNDHLVNLRDWSGRGIITKIVLDVHQLKVLELERYSVIPSAEPFLIFAHLPNHDGIECVIAGKVKQMGTLILKKENSMDQLNPQIQTLAKECFVTDAYGSIEYKAHLVKTQVQNILQVWK